MAHSQEQAYTAAPLFGESQVLPPISATAFDASGMGFQDARKMIPRLPSKTDYEREILSLIESNDFWQNALRYAGPLPAPGPGYHEALALLKRSYAPILKLREVLRRHVRGVIGREPHFEVVLPDLTEDRRKRSKRENYESSRSAMELLADEADRVQGEVWDERGEHTLCDLFLKRLRSVGRAYLRYGVPPGLLAEGVDRDRANDEEIEDGSEPEKVYGVSAGTWQEAYKLMYLELAPRGSAYVHLDPATMRKTAFFSYSEPRPATSTGSKKKLRNCVQISWLEDREVDGEKIKITRVRVVRDDKTADEWELDTGGHLLVIEANMDPLLTRDLLQMQDIGCSVATMVKINDDVAGFPQETRVDMERPEMEIDDPEQPGKKKLVEVPIPTGARTVQYAYSYQDVGRDGKPLLDGNGKAIMRQGTIHYRKPHDSQPLRDDAEWFFKEIYLATNQEHIVARRSAAASAEMLIEMRADYADSLLETKPHLERTLRDIFQARLCAAADIAGDKDALKQFKAGRVRVDANLNAGPLSEAEQNLIITRYEKKLLPKQTTMVLLGSEDVDAEIQQLKEEEREANGYGVPVVRPVAPAKTEKEEPANAQ